MKWHYERWKNRWIVAQVEPYTTVVADVRTTEKHARLIAAAPLLLDIARLTLEVYENGKLGGISPEAKRFEDTLRAVIKQVEGT